MQEQQVTRGRARARRPLPPPKRPQYSAPRARRLVSDHREWRGGWRGRLFRRPANLARAGEGAGGGLWGGRKGTKKLKESAGVGGEGAVQAHRSSSAEAWALAGR